LRLLVSGPDDHDHAAANGETSYGMNVRDVLTKEHIRQNGGEEGTETDGRGTERRRQVLRGISKREKGKCPENLKKKKIRINQINKQMKKGKQNKICVVL
jgi:hypothetical protein